MFLKGNNADIIGMRYGLPDERVIPRNIENMMGLIIDLGNKYSHSTKLTDSEIKKAEERIQKEGINPKYLVFSMALQLCEIASWMNRYITEHPNKDENLQKCKLLPASKTKEEETTGIIEYHNGFYHIGEKYVLSPKVVLQNNLSGKKVKVVKFDNNTNDKSKGKYPFFAAIIQPLEETDNGSK